MDVTRIKLPVWQRDQPEFWFRLVDIQFALYKPAPEEATKVALVCNTIPIDVLQAHQTALADPAPYTALKKAICGAGKKSNAQLFKEILGLKMDGKPSDFLRQSQTLMSQVTKADGTAMTTLAEFQGWLQKHLLERQLPGTVANALVEDTFSAGNAQTYMDRADKLHSSAIDRVEAITETAPTTGDDVAAVTNRQRGGNKKSGGAKKSGGNGKCFYHDRFGDKALKCDGGDCKDRGKPLAKPPQKSD